MKRLFLLISLIVGDIILIRLRHGLRIVRGTGDMSEETREVSGFNSHSS